MVTKQSISGSNIIKKKQNETEYYKSGNFTNDYNRVFSKTIMHAELK